MQYRQACTGIARLLILIAIAAGVGCSSHYSTVAERGPNSMVLYRLSRSEALQLAHYALSAMFPGRTIKEIKGPPPGYSTDYRMLLDTYSQQVLVVPALGSDADGKEVRGCYFEVSGSGTAVVSGRVKNAELFDRVTELADRSGQPIRVTRWKTDYRTDEVIRAARERTPASTRLRDLEQLRREGLVSEEEYRAKRAKILDEM